MADKNAKKVEQDIVYMAIEYLIVVYAVLATVLNLLNMAEILQFYSWFMRPVFFGASQLVLMLLQYGLIHANRKNRILEKLRPYVMGIMAANIVSASRMTLCLVLLLVTGYFLVAGFQKRYSVQEAAHAVLVACVGIELYSIVMLLQEKSTGNGIGAFFESVWPDILFVLAAVLYGIAVKEPAEEETTEAGLEAAGEENAESAGGERAESIEGKKAKTTAEKLSISRVMAEKKENYAAPSVLEEIELDETESKEAEMEEAGLEEIELEEINLEETEPDAAGDLIKNTEGDIENIDGIEDIEGIENIDSIEDEEGIENIEDVEGINNIEGIDDIEDNEASGEKPTGKKNPKKPNKIAQMLRKAGERISADSIKIARYAGSAMCVLSVGLFMYFVVVVGIGTYKIKISEEEIYVLKHCQDTSLALTAVKTEDPDVYSVSFEKYEGRNDQKICFRNSEDNRYQIVFFDPGYVLEVDEQLALHAAPVKIAQPSQWWLRETEMYEGKLKLGRFLYEEESPLRYTSVFSDQKVLSLSLGSGDNQFFVMERTVGDELSTRMVFRYYDEFMPTILLESTIALLGGWSWLFFVLVVLAVFVIVYLRRIIGDRLAALYGVLFLYMLAYESISVMALLGAAFCIQCYYAYTYKKKKAASILRPAD